MDPSKFTVRSVWWIQQIGLPTSRVSIARDNYHLPTLSHTSCIPFFLFPCATNCPPLGGLYRIINIILWPDTAITADRPALKQQLAQHSCLYTSANECDQPGTADQHDLIGSLPFPSRSLHWGSFRSHTPWRRSGVLWAPQSGSRSELWPVTQQKSKISFLCKNVLSDQIESWQVSRWTDKNVSVPCSVQVNGRLVLV